MPLKAIRGKTVDRPLRLIDLSIDPKEVHDLSHEHPEVVRRLMRFAERARAELSDLGRHGHGHRQNPDRDPASGTHHDDEGHLHRQLGELQMIQLTDAAIVVNNENVGVTPNSVEFDEGRGEQTVRAVVK